MQNVSEFNGIIRDFVPRGPGFAIYDRSGFIRSTTDRNEILKGSHTSINTLVGTRRVLMSEKLSYYSNL